MLQDQVKQANILPAETRMGPATLKVANLARAVDFYHRVLGLAVLEQAQTTATLGVGGQPLLRLETVEGGQHQPAFSTGLYHLAIRLPSRAELGRVLLNLARSQ